jgi:hypothetical protein
LIQEYHNNIVGGPVGIGKTLNPEVVGLHLKEIKDAGEISKEHHEKQQNYYDESGDFFNDTF